jgi:hypothetical protein
MSKIDELKVKYWSLKIETFNRLVNGDKTPTRKYTEFLLKSWTHRNSNGCVRTIDMLIDLVNRFDEVLPYIQDKDIYDKKYGHIPTLKEIVDKAETDKELKGFCREEHAEVLYEDDKVLFIIPKTHKGSLKYGAGTRWCTASKNDISTFNNYSKNALLAYLIDKTDDKTISYRKIAFYMKWSETGINSPVVIYNASDNTIDDKSIIRYGWDEELLFKLMTIYRVRFITYKKIKDSVDAINAFSRTLKNLNFDLLKDSLEKLEESVEPSYISNLKENIDGFLKKLNTKQYGITTTEN